MFITYPYPGEGMETYTELEGIKKGQVVILRDKASKFVNKRARVDMLFHAPMTGAACAMVSIVGKPGQGCTVELKNVENPRVKRE
jgi:hypothetical protein